MKTKLKIKHLFFGFSFFLFFICCLLFSWCKTGSKLAKIIIQNQPEKFTTTLISFQKKTRQLETIFYLVKPVRIFFAEVGNLNQMLPDILGQNQTKTYFILLQNNWELRPTGGFMGSYAKIKFKNGGLNDLVVQDIYVPDGQISGHVDPPPALQQAFLTGAWKLRDSNWEPDFSQASKQIAWFFDKGGEEPSDGLIAINFLAIQDLLNILGPINLPDYDIQINHYNFYQITQAQVEKNFFSGSTQKRDFLSSLAKELMFRLQKLDLLESIKLVNLLTNNLAQNQILVYFNNLAPQQWSQKFNFTGEVRRSYHDSENLVADYLYLVDSNLGANKANCCVIRTVTQEINFEKNLLKEKLFINYQNNSLYPNPQPPNFWGGVYKNFLRVLIPNEAENIRIKIDGQNQNEIELINYPDKKIQSVGFFIIVQPQTQSIAEIEYEKRLPEDTLDGRFAVWQRLLRGGRMKYILELQKQPGIEVYSHFVKIMPKNTVIKKNLVRDEILKKTFGSLRIF